MVTKLKQIAYTSTFKNGDELVVRAYNNNGSLMQTPSVFDKLARTYKIECKATRRTSSSPILIVEEKHYKMNPKQYLSFVEKFIENGVDYFNKL